MQVSVIVPIYNVESYLQETLDSIAAQKGISFEVLMINDGSTDHSGMIAEQFAKKDSRFRYIPQQNQGVSAARNHGISIAQGEYIVFCDGDDLLPYGALKALYTTAVKGQADLVVGKIYEVGTAEVALYQSTNRLGKKKTISPSDQDLLWTFMISGKMYRRNFLLEHDISFVPLRYSEDAVFFMNCIYTSHKICGCPHPAYYYRKRTVIQDSSVTQRCSRELWNDFYEAHREVENLYIRFLKNKLSDKQQHIYENALYLKTAESILKAFYRQYWNCEPLLRNEIYETFQQYLQKLNRKNRKLLLEKNSDLFLQRKISDNYYETHPLITVYVSDKVIDKNAKASVKQLQLFLKSLYSQQVIAFQVILPEFYRTRISEHWKRFTNITFTEPGKEPVISTDYVLEVQQLVFFSQNALLHAWNVVNSQNEIQVLSACELGSWYGRLSMKTCAAPCINLPVRIYCKLHEKLPQLFQHSTVRLWRTESWKAYKNGTFSMKKNIMGCSSFRTLRY